MGPLCTVLEVAENWSHWGFC